MTNEEAIKVLDNALYGGGNAFVMSEFRDAIKLALRTLKQEHILKTAELGTLSLPSNLDEAAVQFAQRGYSPFDDPYEASKVFENVVNCFKAGAEWMAGQGYTTEGIAHPDDCEVWVDFTSTDIKDGDEVIVQIRKK